MAINGKIKWDEGPISESGSAANTELHYFLWSDDPANDDRGIAFAWVRENSPDTLFGLFKDSINLVERVADAENAKEPYAIWDANVKYVNAQRKTPKTLELDPDDPNGPQDVRLSIRSGTGGQLLRTYSIALEAEIASDPWKWAGSDAAKLLNVIADDSEDGAMMFSAKGISVPVGTVELVVETVISAYTALSDNYLINAALLAGKNVINEIPYRGFDERSLKLINFDSTQRGGDEADSDKNDAGWDVIYTFAYSPTIPNAEIAVAPGVGLGASWNIPADKGGWDYLDTTWINTVVDIGGNKFTIPQAKRQAIHRIYELANFATELRI